jgi:hypothetical protein
MAIVTKVEVAHRQLRVAIRLWSEDGDQVAIHSLAASAHQIVHDLNRRNKGPALLFDSDHVPKERRQEFVRSIKSASWFMKHADQRRAGATTEFDFDPDWNNHLIMFSIFGLRYLGEKLTIEEVAFERWHALHSPELMTDEGKEVFEKEFPIHLIGAMRALPKRKFFEGICDFLREHERHHG